MRAAQVARNFGEP